ncbi:MAG: ABC transporter permease [Methanolobus sp.]
MYKEKEVGATIYGVDAEEEELVTNYPSAMVEGEFISKLDRGEIVLGRELSGGYGAVMQTRSLEDVSVGDIVTVMVDGQEMNFRVKGIYSTLFFMSDSSAFVNKKDLEEALNAEDKAHEIAIKIRDDADEEYVREEILFTWSAGRSTHLAGICRVYIENNRSHAFHGQEYFHCSWSYCSVYYHFCGYFL